MLYAITTLISHRLELKSAVLHFNNYVVVN